MKYYKASCNPQIRIQYNIQFKLLPKISNFVKTLHLSIYLSIYLSINRTTNNLKKLPHKNWMEKINFRLPILLKLVEWILMMYRLKEEVESLKIFLRNNWALKVQKMELKKTNKNIYLIWKNNQESFSLMLKARFRRRILITTLSQLLVIITILTKTITIITTIM